MIYNNNVKILYQTAAKTSGLIFSQARPTSRRPAELFVPAREFKNVSKHFAVCDTPGIFFCVQYFIISAIFLHLDGSKLAVNLFRLSRKFYSGSTIHLVH